MNLVMKLSISIWQLKYALSWGEGHGINNIILNKSFTVIIDLLLVFKEIYIYIYIQILIIKEESFRQVFSFLMIVCFFVALVKNSQNCQ